MQKFWCRIFSMVVLLAPAVTQAQVDYFWRSDSADPGDGYNWNTANNWWRGFVQAPAGSENIIIDNNHKSGSIQTNNLSNANRYRILFNAGASSARTITGSTENTFFDFGGNVPRIANSDTGVKTLAFPIRAGYNNFEINANGDGITIDRLDLQGHNLNVSGDGGHTLTIRGEVRGSGSITIQSNTTVSITGVPTNNGTMTINAGVLRYGATTGAGHTNTINVGATSGSAAARLFIGSSGVTVSNRITVRSGSSGIKTIGNLSAGAATFSGAMMLQASVMFSNAAGGSLTFSGGVDFNSAQRTLTVPLATTVTISGAISGDGGNGMAKHGDGVLRLAGNNSYTGSTSIDTGNVTVVSGGNLGSGSDVYIASSATLTTEVSVSVGSLREKASSNSGTATIGSGATVTVTGANKGDHFMNTISGAGGLTMSGSGTTRMRLFGNNSYSGSTIINSATLGLWGSGSITGSPLIFIGTNATFEVAGRSSALTLASGQSIVVLASSSGSPATIATASSTGTLTMASSGSIIFGSYSSGGGAPLAISGNGSLSLAAGNSVIVTNTGSALTVGSYKLISKGASSAVGGTAPGSVTVAGNGMVAGASASLSISSGELFLIVVSTEPDVLVLGNTAEIVDGSTSPSAANHTDFGDALAAGGSVARTFTVTNSGAATLNIGNVVTNAGGNPGDFIVTSQPGSLNLAAGATTTFQVQFDPSAPGVRFADIQFTNNVTGAKNPYTFRIQGTGTYVEVAVTMSGASIADGDGTPDTADGTDFGVVGTAGGLSNITYTITNSGNRAMTIGNVTTSGTDAADFIVTAQPSGTLAPSNTTTFTVQFNPSANGLRSAALSFSTTDDSHADGLTENPFNFSVQGTGAGTGISNLPTSLNFSSVLGSSPSPQIFTVSNVGLGTLTYSVDTNYAWLSVSNTSGSAAAGAGNAHTAHVAFSTGIAVGTSNATITITGTDGFTTNSPKTVAVSWTIGAIPNPTAQSATADGKEMVRLAWTKDASYNVMIIHRSGGTPAAPTNGTVYSVGYAFADGSRVIAFNTSTTSFEHIVAAGSANNYAFYSVNNNHFSPGVSANVTMESYRTGEIVDPGAYTNGVAISGLNTGNGWSGGWVTTGSGTWVAQTNYSAGGGADVPSLLSPVNYPVQAANRITVGGLGNNESATARKTFTAVNSGTIYMAGLVAYRNGGNNKFVGLSFMNGTVETGFVGKAGGASLLAIDTYGGTKSNGTTTLGATATATGNVYLIIAKYSFTTKQIQANAYLWNATLPGAEPGSWEATATVPGSGISSIDGVRVAGGGFSGESIGNIWFDEIRVASSWPELLGLGAVYATNYVIGNATNHVFDGQVAAGAFPVMMALRSADGVESVSTTPPYFLPNFDVLNPSGALIVSDQTFAVRSHLDSGRTLIASNTTHTVPAQTNVVLGVYTSAWSAVSSNGLQALNVSVLSNNMAITFTVVDDDTTAPVLQDFHIFGSSGNATLTVPQLVSGNGWAITGLVQDAGSGINVNGSSVSQPNSSPYFELWDASGTLRLRQAFLQIPFTNGEASASLTSIGSTNNNTMAAAPLGIWTARVVVADADNDRVGDRTFATNTFTFEVVLGDSTAGIGNMPSLVNITSTYGVVAGTSPWPNFTVTNIGTSPLVYNLEINYNSGFGWFSAMPTGATVNAGASQIHTGAVNISSLNPGNYESVLVFNGNQTNGARYVTNRLTVIGYNAGEIVDPFTNAAGNVNGAAGGSGWTNAWAGSGGFVFSNSNLATPNNYPAAQGRKISGNTAGTELNAYRNFQAFTNGKVFMAVAAQKSDGNSDGFFGISFLNGSTEVAFAGKLFNNGNFGLDLGSNGGPVSGGFGANGNSVYMFIGMYDFDDNTFYVKAYNSGDTLPLVEPSWGGSKQPTTPIARIDGVRLAGKDEGLVYFDEVRVAQSWEALLNQFTLTPTLHATAMAFANVSTSGMTVGWSPGNGLNRIVVAREGAAVTFVPTNGVTYTPNSEFSVATDMGDGNKIVYNASGSSVPVSGLNATTRYFYAVFEYNGGGASASYYTNAGFLTGDRWTLAEEPAGAASGLAAFTMSSSSISNTWTQAAGSPAASGYIILRSHAAVTNEPVDGVGYTNGQSIGAAVASVVTPGTMETYVHTGLTSCSNHHFKIFSFRWNGSAAETRNYKTDVTSSASAETTCTTPDVQAQDILFTLVGTNRIELAWTPGSGQARLVIVRGTNAVNQDPVDGTTYTANTTFGSGSHLGNGNFVAYNSTGSSVEVTGLFPGSTYHFRIYEYNGSGSGIDYNTTTTNNNPRSTATASFGLVEDKFSYSAGNIFGANGGTGWTNSWNTLSGLMEVVDGNFGAFGAYPADSGTRQGYLNSTTKRSATRNFPPRTTGKLYFAVKINVASSVQNAYFGVNLLNGAASGGAGDNSVTGFFGKANGVADNKLSLLHNGSIRTNRIDGTNPGYQIGTGIGNDYLLVAMYDFDANQFKARAYVTNQLAHTDAESEDAWLVEMDNVNIERIDGIELIGSGLGNCYFDHIRIGPSWEEVMWNLPDNWHEDSGPAPTLVYIGTNYNSSVYNQTVTNLSDAELKSSSLIDFAVRWDSASGVYVNNSGTNHIGSPDGRITPNWDPLSVGVASNEFGLDRFFTNYFGVNGSSVVTTYQKSAFNITNIDFELQYFVTVSAETHPGGSTVTAPAGGDPVPVTRAITINEPLRFYVYDDDTNEPVAGSEGLVVMTNNSVASFQSAGADGKRYFITDGGLASSGMDVSLNAYDAYSGLQRASSGDVATNMHLTVSGLVASNISYFSAARSTPEANSTNAAASNVWEFSSALFNTVTISSLWGGDGSSLQGQDLDVRATIPDNDRDRLEDQTYLSDALFGYIRLTDDDVVAPTMSTAVVAGAAGDAWISANQLTVNWAAASDADTGIGAYRVVAPAMSPVMPTTTNDGLGVSGGVTGTVVGIAGQQGVLTGYVFAVDADNDRANDALMGNVIQVTARVDTNPPPRVNQLRATDSANDNVFDPAIDDSSEIKVEWSAFGTEAEAAGWRNQDGVALSPWDTYVVTFSEVTDTNGVAAPNAITTVWDRTVAAYSNILNTYTFTNMVLSNLNFDSYYKVTIQGKDAAGNIGLSTSVIGNTDRFVVTQGLARAGYGVSMRWTGPTNEAVFRDYDVLYVDSSQGFRTTMTNQWQFMTYTNRPVIVDEGAAGRTNPAFLTNTTYRFYRVAKQDRWKTNNSPRVGSVEVYVAKGVTLYPGENWYSLPAFPDPATENEMESTVAYVFGTNLLPRGGSSLSGTKISWFGSTLSGDKYGSSPTAVVWLANSGWQWLSGGTGNANSKRVPLGQAFLIELPVAANPTNFVFVGRLPTQSIIHVISGEGASSTNATYHLVSHAMPERIPFSSLGISTNNGFRGGANIGESDEVRILNNQPDAASFGSGSLRAPKYRIFWRTTDKTWRSTLPGLPVASGLIIEPEDAIVFVRRHNTTIVWTNGPVMYAPPTKNFTP